MRLSDTVVVELGARIGAGVCGSLLAHLGAQVVFVEPREPRNDWKWRDRPQFAADKLSIRIDVSRPDDLDLLRATIARADVIITSTDLPDALQAEVGNHARDSAIHCDITAYGNTGPRAGRADDEWQIQATSGILDTTGLPGRAPVPIGLPVVEFMTGVYAAAGVLAALRARRISGVGQAIDMALYDCAFAAMATFLPSVLTGSAKPVERAGNNHALISPWNVYRARDGWLLICAGSDAQWKRLCEMMDRPELADDPGLATNSDRVRERDRVDAAMQDWVAGLSVAECAERLNAANIANGAIIGIDPHPQEPNLEFRGMIRTIKDPVSNNTLALPGIPLRLGTEPAPVSGRIAPPDGDRTAVQRLVLATSLSEPAANGKATSTPAPPLAGVTVLEIGHYTTVPLSTRHLGALGAEVIKVEPPEGEATRGWVPVQDGQGYFFTYMNSDKRSVVVDMRTDEGAAQLETLIRRSDVVIENLKPGALARRGFSVERIAEINPRAICCSVSGFGAHSLYAGRPAYDSVIQAMSGIMDVVVSDGIPVKTGISIADLLGAETALLGVLAALERRDREGTVQPIDLSMQDIAAWLSQQAWNGVGGRTGERCLVRCPDGYVLVGAPGSEPATLAQAGVAPPERTGDATTDSDTGLASALDSPALVERLAGMGIAATQVRRVNQLVDCPQTLARALWFQASDDDGRNWPLMASPLRLSLTPARVRDPMPPLGRDTRAILGEPVT